MKRIGVIGRGFVGTAVEYGFSAQTGCDAELRSYNLYELNSQKIMLLKSSRNF